jgi:hypothetical protein
MLTTKETHGTTLYCFSPPVVLATFLIEAGLAIYAWWRYRSSRYGRLATVFLFLLAGFQISEFMICLGNPAEIWSRVGFVCTAFLPIIAIDFVMDVRHKRVSLAAGYALATAISLIIFGYPGIFQDAACTGYYVVFQTQNPGFDVLYSIYYFAALFTGIFLALEGYGERGSNHRALFWSLIGYAFFMVPSFALYAATVITKSAFSSVLCGFAVLLALIIAFKILPLIKPGKE